MAAAGLAVLVYGCKGGDTCADRETCPAASDAGFEANAEASALAGDADAEGGAMDATSEEAAVCDRGLTPKDDPCVLSDAYGVFVASPGVTDSEAATVGAAAGGPLADGSMAKPYPSIGQALANVGSKTRVYVCNGLYPEQVLITTPVAIYGGLSCELSAADRVWQYVGGSAQVTSPSPGYALTVAVPVEQAGDDAGGDAADGDDAADGGDAAAVGGPVTIADMTFASPDATALGGSSLGALIVSSSVTLVRVALRAGRGADGWAGADGATMPNYQGLAAAGGDQVVAASGFGVAPGPGASNACLRFGASAGGNGGLGCALGAGFGSPGTSDPSALVTQAGRDGLPQLAALPDGGPNPSNDPGADGTAGDGGAASEGYGTLAPSGWTPGHGSDGAFGNPGQGGAGAADPLADSNCNAPLASIGGGGGGAGGCGGAGGQAGLGGGASIALVSLASAVVLQGCDLSTSAAGTGGAGGSGQDGQGGGVGGDDVNTSYVHAAGGAGGNGAGGSGGAGGTGGVSVGILYQGGLVTSDPSTQIAVGAPGAGGPAGAAGRTPVGAPFTTGAAGNPGSPGGAGVSMPVLSLL
jgi:hypothetical protein